MTSIVFSCLMTCLLCDVVTLFVRLYQLGPTRIVDFENYHESSSRNSDRTFVLVKILCRLWDLSSGHGLGLLYSSAPFNLVLKVIEVLVFIVFFSFCLFSHYNTLLRNQFSLLYFPYHNFHIILSTSHFPYHRSLMSASDLKLIYSIFVFHLFHFFFSWVHTDFMGLCSQMLSMTALASDSNLTYLILICHKLILIFISLVGSDAKRLGLSKWSQFYMIDFNFPQVNTNKILHRFDWTRC